MLFIFQGIDYHIIYFLAVKLLFQISIRSDISFNIQHFWCHWIGKTDLFCFVIKDWWMTWGVRIVVVSSFFKAGFYVNYYFGLKTYKLAKNFFWLFNFLRIHFQIISGLLILIHVSLLLLLSTNQYTASISFDFISARKTFLVV